MAMKRRLAVLLSLLLAVAGAAFYYVAFLTRNREAQASAAILVVGGKETMPVETQALIMRSEKVLSKIVSALERSPWANRLPGNQGDRLAYLYQRLKVSGDGGPNSQKMLSALELRFRAEDGDMAKGILDIVIEAFRDELAGIYDGATARRIITLEAAISGQSERVKVDREELALKMQQVNDISRENSKEIEGRVAKAIDTLENLTIQRKLAETPERAAKLDSVIQEIEVKLKKNESTLNKLRPLLNEIATLTTAIQARLKNSKNTNRSERKPI
jgi:hypothetical protein